MTSGHAWLALAWAQSRWDAKGDQHLGLDHLFDPRWCGAVVRRWLRWVSMRLPINRRSLIDFVLRIGGFINVVCRRAAVHNLVPATTTACNSAEPHAHLGISGYSQAVPLPHRLTAAMGNRALAAKRESADAARQI
jgi:hypothetical protein